MDKQNKIKIKLNGKIISVNKGINLNILIKKFKFPLNKIAIEKNNLIVSSNIARFNPHKRRKEWELMTKWKEIFPIYIIAIS